VKTVETVLFGNYSFSPWFKPWAKKCNDMSAMDLSISFCYLLFDLARNVK